MSENITVIDYEEIKLYTLINKKGREIKNSYEQSAYIDNDDWECFQDFGIQYINDAVYNNMDCKEVKDILSGCHFFIYNNFIRKVDGISEGDYVRIKKYNDVTSHFKIKETTWNKFYSRPLLVKYISPSGNCDLEYDYEGDKISFYFNQESIRYLCTSEEVNIFQKMFSGSKTVLDKEPAKISVEIDTIEDREKSYIDIDSVLSKNPSDKNTKLTLFFNYILRYNNTENIDDFLKRFEKSWKSIIIYWNELNRGHWLNVQ